METMNLKKGIRLHSLFKDGFDQVFMNSGTSPYREQVLEKVNFQNMNFVPLFEDHAYLPKKDWKSIDQRTITRLKADENRKDYNTIYAGDIPEPLKEALQKLELQDSADRDQVMNKFRANPEAVQLVNTAMQSFLSTISDHKPFHFHCIAANLPNLEMVACDITTLPPNFTVPDKKYIGLHNDGTQYMTLHTTYKFGNRITINLGKQPRVFYFVNLTMIQVLNMLKQKPELKMHDINIRNIAAHFFKYFPDYPVIKIIQKPYQYYIAPTDNCFHDGSTLGNTALDINMVYFGAFKC